MKVRERRPVLEALQVNESFQIVRPRQVTQDTTSELTTDVDAGDWLLIEDGRLRVIPKARFITVYEVLSEESA